jgi:hypothetical protein
VRRKKRPVLTYTRLKQAQAICRDCRFKTQAKNSMALAKQHTATYGHAVEVEQTISVRYLPDERRSPP